jgi:hypothetical protein
MKIKFILIIASACFLAACAQPEATRPTRPASKVNPPKTPPEYGETPRQQTDTAINDSRSAPADIPEN